MPQPEVNRLQSFHNSLIKGGLRVGSLDEFRTILSDPEKRVKFHGILSKGGYRAGSYEEFEKAIIPHLGEVKRTEPGFLPRDYKGGLGRKPLEGTFGAQILRGGARLAQSAVGITDLGYRLIGQHFHEPEERERVFKAFEKFDEKLEVWKGRPKGVMGYTGAVISDVSAFVLEAKGVSKVLAAAKYNNLISKMLGRVPKKGLPSMLTRLFARNLAHNLPVFATVEGVRDLGPMQDRAERAYHGLKMGVTFSWATMIPGGFISPGALVRIPLGTWALGTAPWEVGKLIADPYIPTEEKLTKLVDFAVNAYFMKRGQTKETILELHRDIAKEYHKVGEPVPKAVTESLRELGDIVKVIPEYKGKREKISITRPAKKVPTKYRGKKEEVPVKREETVEDLEKAIEEFSVAELKIRPKDRTTLRKKGYTDKEVAGIKDVDELLEKLAAEPIREPVEPEVRPKTFIEPEKGKVTLAKIKPRVRPRERKSISPPKEVPVSQRIEPTDKVIQDLKAAGLSIAEIESKLPTMTPFDYVDITREARKETPREKKVEERAEEIHEGYVSLEPIAGIKDIGPRPEKRTEELRLGLEERYGGGPTWEDLKASIKVLQRLGVDVDPKRVQEGLKAIPKKELDKLMSKSPAVVDRVVAFPKKFTFEQSRIKSWVIDEVSKTKRAGGRKPEVLNAFSGAVMLKGVKETRVDVQTYKPEDLPKGLRDEYRPAEYLKGIESYIKKTKKENKKFDVIISDPPFGKGLSVKLYAVKLPNMMEVKAQYLDILKPGGTIISFGFNPSSSGMGVSRGFVKTKVLLVERGSLPPYYGIVEKNVLGLSSKDAEILRINKSSARIKEVTERRKAIEGKGYKLCCVAIPIPFLPWKDITQTLRRWNDEGFRKEAKGYVEGMKKAASNAMWWLEQTPAVFDVQRPFRKEGAPETGFHFKNFFSFEESYVKRTVAKMEELKAMYRETRWKGMSKEDRADIVLYHENPRDFKQLSKKEQKRLKPGIDFLKDYLEGYQKQYKDRGIELDFVGNRLLALEEKLTKAEGRKDTEANREIIKDLRAEIKATREIRFAHIPLFWFQKYEKRGATERIGALKILAKKRRKSFTIKDLIEEGVIKKEDVDVLDIIWNYGLRAGHDFAVLNIADAAVKEGQAIKGKKSKVVDGEKWIKNPPGTPALKGFLLRKWLADYIYSVTNISRKGWLAAGAQGILTTIKMFQFYNPIFLPGYDLTQHLMAIGTGAWKSPKYAAEAYRLMRDRPEEYYQILGQGLASKPYESPFKSLERMREHIKRSGEEKTWHLMKDLFSPRILRDFYQASWTTAWHLDEFVRLMTNQYLKDKGFSPRDAAQGAAMLHSDYASVPRKTREVLNYFLFTPTFKITMGKLYLNMMESAVKEVRRKETTDMTAMYARSLVHTAAICQAFDSFMNVIGFRTDQWGRRYVKEVMTDEGSKELVLTWSMPANMFLKYLYRVRDAVGPGVDNSLMTLYKSMSWELHPAWRIAQNIVNNKGEGFEYIWHPFDPWTTKWKKAINYALLKTIRLGEWAGKMTGAIEPGRREAIANKKFAEDTSKTFEMLSRFVTFKYIRSPAELREAYRLRAMMNKWAKLCSNPDTFPTQEQMIEFQKEMERIIKASEGPDLLEESTVGP